MLWSYIQKFIILRSILYCIRKRHNIMWNVDSWTILILHPTFKQFAVIHLIKCHYMKYLLDHIIFWKYMNWNRSLLENSEKANVYTFWSSGIKFPLRNKWIFTVECVNFRISKYLFPYSFLDSRMCILFLPEYQRKIGNILFNNI